MKTTLNDFKMQNHDDLFDNLIRLIDINLGGEQEVGEMYGTEEFARKSFFWEHTIDEIKLLYFFVKNLDQNNTEDCEFVFSKMHDYYKSGLSKKEVVSSFFNDRVQALEFLESEIAFRIENDLIEESYTYYGPLRDEAIKQYYFNQEDIWKEDGYLPHYNYYKEYNDRVYNRKRGLLGGLFN